MGLTGGAASSDGAGRWTGETRGLALVLALAVLLHALIWIVLPVLLEGSIRLDVAEGAIGGQHWRIVYARHPPFTLWLTELARQAGPARYAVLYAIAQMLALGGLAGAVWLAHAIGGARAAVLAAAMGLLSPYLTISPLELNHNIGVMLFWGLTLATAWLAFTRGSWWAWVLFGCAVGGGMWAKYAILHLVAGLGIAFLIVPSWRRQLASAGPWLALLAGAVILVPQIWVLATADASPLGWAVRTAASGWMDRAAGALAFTGATLGAIAPMMLIAALATPRPRTLPGSVRRLLFAGPSDPPGVFLTWAAMGPFLVIVLADLGFGVDAKSHWLTPMALSFAAWWAIAAVRAGAEPAGRRLGWGIGALAAAFILGYGAIRLLSPLVQDRPGYPDFDGPAMADLARSYWEEVSDRPLEAIVTQGVQKGRQLGGSLAFDLGQPVNVFEDASPHLSPWTSADEVRCSGALVASTVPISPETLGPDLPIEAIRVVDRPLVRGASSERGKAWLGYIPPACN
ncbi:ArnT family glycosyltransferase [Amorphus orientalis]|uniref:4-amino-4-deoxy-L-arabinose transferase-like glycosyltransferase n=1 Tax=Amorphus orientalis TaxID=649198 RepID=A0AAE4AU08_9HYPH|nr:glycosyltransferase family 39 protein [Amorphus orientalis]MDQ0316677.1 4-amino-4-deoxy-L-arabinose transferase-like glycosyltransferase [Amorphus orientalis]